MVNSVRVERLLRELHASPPLRFLENVFSLTEFASGKISALQEAMREAASGQGNDQIPV